MGILWTIIIGFVAGLIAKFLHPGPNEPTGFILTTILGIVGAFLATYLGQALGWYRAGEGAGLIGAVVGAIIILVIWVWWRVGQPEPCQNAELSPRDSELSCDSTLPSAVDHTAEGFFNVVNEKR